MPHPLDHPLSPSATSHNTDVVELTEEDLGGQMATQYFWVAMFKNYVSVGSISIGVCTYIVKVTINNSSMYVNITINPLNAKGI